MTMVDTILRMLCDLGNLWIDAAAAASIVVIAPVFLAAGALATAPLRHDY